MKIRIKKRITTTELERNTEENRIENGDGTQQGVFVTHPQSSHPGHASNFLF